MSLTRRAFLQSAAMGVGALAVPLLAEARVKTNLHVAYAGSMGALMHGGVAPVMAREFSTNIEGRAAGALGLAHMIVGGVIHPDVFISITRGPMDLVLAAGKAQEAFAIASTELVIAYSAHSRFTPALREADRAGHAAWWQVLEEPGMRFARTDPLTDPQGLNIVFMMKLASATTTSRGLRVVFWGPSSTIVRSFRSPR